MHSIRVTRTLSAELHNQNISDDTARRWSENIYKNKNGLFLFAIGLTMVVLI